MPAAVLAIILAAQPLDREAYADRHALVGRSHPGWQDIRGCLEAWEDHPFQDPETSRFRTLQSSTRVMGFGAELRDDTPTTYPQLVLVKPSVNVLTRTTYELRNPNGWYCLAGSVSVLANHRIVAACGAHLAHADGAVLKPGAGDAGTAVLGSIEVILEACDEAVGTTVAEDAPTGGGAPAPVASVDARTGRGGLRWGDAPDARYEPVADRAPLPEGLDVRVLAEERERAAAGGLTVAGQPVDRILYGFHAGQFVAYAIHPAGAEALAALREALRAKYGDAEGDTWRGERVEVAVRDGWLVYSWLPGLPAAAPALDEL